MPATEQTWRNQKVMHVVFACSALVMAFATLWLLAKDHNREWKRWQLTDRKKEAWMTQSQHDSLAFQYASKMEDFAADIRVAQAEKISAGLIDDFKRLVTEDAERLDKAAANFDSLDALFALSVEDSDAASDARQTGGQAGEVVDQETSKASSRAEAKAIDSRQSVVRELQKFVSDAIRLEKGVVAQRKSVAADRTAAVSELGLRVGEGASAEIRNEVQSRVDNYTTTTAELTAEIVSAQTYRTELESIVKQIDAPQVELEKQRGVMTTELTRLEEQVYLNTSNQGEWVTRLPVLDALYDGNVQINQIWLPELTINFNFSQVARFDRCKSCHQAISQTAPGTASDPAFATLPDSERELTISLATPDSAPEEDSSLLDNEKVRDVYGLKLADEGMVNYADVTVQYVLPESLASKAGIEAGDVILLAGDQPAYEPEVVTNYLLQAVSWGEPLSLSVRRGLDHPFTSHPRLDLYLTDSSPHVEKEFGCTVCHDGQGSGTSFPWTSHSPNDSEQQSKWADKLGWFDNHHWIFPMKPSRFVESNCMKCHHEKGSLVASERFPDPPAPKLVEGWSLVEKFGCFGCHEVNGFDGPDKRIGPDVRLEPNWSEVAAQILHDEKLTEEQRDWAKTLIATPSNASVRHQLFVALKKDADQASSDEAILSSVTHTLADGLKDVDAPGQYRKAGPSLRFLNSKVDFNWLHSWISQPADFRPSTRMPQFFGLHEHLQDPEDADELAMSERYEPVEIRAMAEFLLNNSSEFEYLDMPAEVTEAASAERGKWLFESRGCLACHSHEGFNGIAADQGPDLSRVSAKFQSEKGSKWLYSWIKQPHRYHVRTKMPELFLDPIAEIDTTGKPTGKITDPAADMREFLMSGATDWKPAAVERNWSPAELEALEDLAQEWITSDAIPAASAKEFVQKGFPEHMGSRLKSDEKILLGMTAENHVAKLQEYVARRSISKHGCFGCHDIPSFEGAKPIGTALADWGRKETSKLAFENIHKFLEGPGNPNANDLDAHGDHGAHGEADEHVAHGHLDPADFDPDTSYYIQSLSSHSRDGFIWQKLRMPRSYDYKTMKNKGYNERLRMPKFPITTDEREAIITFVLGLVNEPPAEQLIYHPDLQQKAIVEGRQVLEKFNCAGCHTMQMEQWDLAFEEGTFDSQSEVVDFPFLAKHFSEPEFIESLKKDSRGMLSATLHGLPVLSEETGQPQRVDEDGLELEPDDDESDPYYLFTLWEDGIVEGNPWLQGVQDIMIPANPEGYGPADGTAYPGWGGTLARYLYPRAIAKAKETNPQVKGSEAWGWLPPPLMDEGAKVQTDWLHGFLMDPTKIRPAAIMRMPNFHMSSDDATKLVDYFAAVSGAEFPYEYKSRQRASYLAGFDADQPERLSDAMNIVVNSNYCVKCHAVGDFTPQGDPTTFGPNLAEVYRRLRPEYIRNWVANPKRTLPYTGMPVNIPFEAGIAQNIFHGTSVEQLDGLIDLLMNYDVYTLRQTSVEPLVKAAAPAVEAGKEEEDETPAEEEADSE